MRTVLALLLFVAACGGKSPAPATSADPDPVADPTPPPSDVGGVPEDGYPPDECDPYCADGCNEVEEYELCRQDCGCSATPED